ncbi:hypothetical protein H8E88_20395 [candidate division KSB1 bacterium]|nr:hypothetical protein [candidate division KSB1 bacterium]MBL7094581.1 hypothetical protein [candidate division KSB1 bacterium]
MTHTRLILLIVIIISLVFQTGIKAQEQDTTESEINIKKMRLPLPAYAKNSMRYTIEDEIANLLADILERIGVHDVLAGIELNSTLINKNSTAKKYTIVTFKELNGIREEIVVSATEISQFNVEPEEKETYFTLKRSIFKKNANGKTQTDSTNIFTEIYTLLNFFDNETGNHLGFLEIIASHAGGSPKQSKEKALADLWQKLKMELKKIYWLYADIETTTKGKLKLPFGTNYGVGKGALFELVEPERIWEDEDGEYIVPGGCVGFASVVDTASDSSSLKIIRSWQNYSPGSWMVDFFDQIDGFELNFVAPATDYYFNFGIHYHMNPMSDFDGGYGMQFIRVSDSYGDKNFGFGFHVFGIWRFLNTSRFDLGLKVGLNIDFPFKKDDEGQIANTALISLPIGILAEIPLSKQFDFVFCTGYRFAAKSTNWDTAEEDDVYSVIWNDDPPEVNNTGFILSAGFKYYLY